MLSTTEISRRLAAALPPPEKEDCTAAWIQATPRPAAVLIPFLALDDAWHILYTRRTDHLAQHKGQVAFPGGRSDPGDPSPQFTALREAEEEIGVHPMDVQVLGRLAALPTTSGYCITPIVGVIPWPYPLVLAEREVVRTFCVPLAWLADAAHREVRTRLLPDLGVTQPVIYFQHYGGELLWGVSAEITVNLLAALGL
ncbi:MAG: NUDIX hydrolase [Chloroflexota bacterium]